MTDHVVETGVMAGSERDSGSCSSVDEDSRSSLHSPTSSEDSVEVQVTPISLRNKRKLAEPRKIQETAVIAAPLKKRRFDPISEETTVDQEAAKSLNTSNPFRPWIPTSYKNEFKTTTTSTTTDTISNTTATIPTTTTTTTITTLSSEREEREREEKRRKEDERRKEEEEEERGKEQDETTQRLHESFRRLQHSTSHNRSAVTSRREPRQRLFEPTAPATTATTTSPPSMISPSHPRLQDEPLSLVVRNESPRVPSHPAVSGSYEKTPSYMMEHLLAATSGHNHQNHQTHQSQRSHQSHQTPTTSRHQSGQQRNYKNMTRERRIEANARERTRVHTISAAFDTLRRAIPAFSHNQKLSKLSVLRIACSYIMTLGKILGKDNEIMATSSNGLTGLSSCVDLVSRTIQTEGKLRKRKDD
ncbi:general transcriptional corepressor trfA isoform X2 [Monomorium pharaonis]|uniref:general transcriptional corepressor trfA isoform X2 n=1 Tax=Monomorium pharaonis TaxID=307658 RepID=UPI00102E1A4D|nr:general transcriptional corepressor trfA isoform X2 [Monomorium pharaonis]